MLGAGTANARFSASFFVTESAKIETVFATHRPALARATSGVTPAKSRTLKRGGVAHLLVQAERLGLLAFSACTYNYCCRFRGRAGPSSSNAAPLGAGRTACGTERVISHAHNIGALRALPQRWVTRRLSGFVQGGDFLPKIRDSRAAWRRQG
jgi:hypothetical protein